MKDNKISADNQFMDVAFFQECWQKGL